MNIHTRRYRKFASRFHTDRLGEVSIHTGMDSLPNSSDTAVKNKNPYTQVWKVAQNSPKGHDFERIHTYSHRFFFLQVAHSNYIQVSIHSSMATLAHAPIRTIVKTFHTCMYGFLVGLTRQSDSHEYPYP